MLKQALPAMAADALPTMCRHVHATTHKPESSELGRCTIQGQLKLQFTNTSGLTVQPAFSRHAKEIPEGPGGQGGDKGEALADEGKMSKASNGIIAGKAMKGPHSSHQRA